MTKKTFVQWLRSTYKKSNTPYEDLLTDILHDRSFPIHTSTRKKLRAYLEDNNACDACLDVFEEAFKMYQEYKQSC